MLVKIRAILLLLVMVSIGPLSFACQCGTAGGHNPWEIAQLRVNGGNTVFEGKVVSLRLRWKVLAAKDGEWMKTGFEGHSPSDYPYIVATLEVLHNHRGNLGKTVEINTGVGGGDCGFLFNIGEEYLVFASPLYSDKNAKFGLWTTICSGTARMSANTAELRYLRGERPLPEDLVNFWEHEKLEASARAKQASRKFLLGTACVSTDGEVGEEANVLLLPALGHPSFRHEIPIMRRTGGRFCASDVPPGRYYALLRQYDNHNYGPVLMSYSPGVYRRDKAEPFEVKAGETTQVTIRPLWLQTQRVSAFIFLQNAERLGADTPRSVWLIGLDDGPMCRMYFADFKVDGFTKFAHLAHVSFPSVLPGNYLVWIDDSGGNMLMKKRTVMVADRSQTIFVRLKAQKR